MNRRLVIEGNAVYELDEKCMLKKTQNEKGEYEEKNKEYSNAVREEKNRME